MSSFAVAIALPITIVAMLSPLTALAAEPAPPPAPELGRTGQVVLPELAGIRTGMPLQFRSFAVGPLSRSASDIGWAGVLGYSRTQEELTSADGALSHGNVDVETLWVAPAADVFVRPRVSIGLAAELLWANWKRVTDAPAGLSGYEGYSITVAPRIGYLVPLGGGFSFWPRLSTGFSYAKAAAGSLSEGLIMGSASRTFGAGLDLGLVYHPTERLVVKLAPQIGVGRSMFTGAAGSSVAFGEATWIRVGGEATVGVVL